MFPFDFCASQAANFSEWKAVASVVELPANSEWTVWETEAAVRLEHRDGSSPDSPDSFQATAIGFLAVDFSPADDAKSAIKAKLSFDGAVIFQTFSCLFPEILLEF